MNNRILSIAAIIISLVALLFAVNANTRLDQAINDFANNPGKQIELSTQEELQKTRDLLTDLQDNLQQDQNYQQAADQVVEIRSSMSENFRLSQRELNAELNNLESQLRTNSLEAIDTLKIILSNLDKKLEVRKDSNG